MKPVVQEDRTGCGIAVVAAAAEIPYRQAKRAAASMGIFARDKTLWSETLPVRQLAKRFGLKTSLKQKPFRSWASLPNLALLSIKWHLEGRKPFWHWVLFVRENGSPRVLDSKKGLHRNARADFGRMQPKWYIALKKPNQVQRRITFGPGRLEDHQ